MSPCPPTDLRPWLTPLFQPTKACPIRYDLSVIAGTSLVIIVTLAVGIWLAILAIGIVCLRKYV